MPHFWKKKAILAKIESSYGTDPTPTGAANAILATEARLSTVANEVSRNLDVPYMGAQESLMTNVHRELTFEVEAAGSGTNDVAPAWGVLHRMAKHAEVITEDTDVQYAPISENPESGTIYFNLGGRLYKMLGCRGGLGGRFNAGEIPKWIYKFKGLFVAATDTALPAVTLTGFQKPKHVSDANTPDFKINDIDVKMRGFDFDNGAKTEGRFLVNQEEIIVGDHELSFNIDIERPTIATIDLEAIARNQTLVPIDLVHGTTAGHIIELSFPTSQLMWPEAAEFQTIVHDRIRGKAIPASAGADYLITCK